MPPVPLSEEGSTQAAYEADMQVANSLQPLHVRGRQAACEADGRTVNLLLRFQPHNLAPNDVLNESGDEV